MTVVIGVVTATVVVVGVTTVTVAIGVVTATVAATVTGGGGSCSVGTETVGSRGVEDTVDCVSAVVAEGAGVVVDAVVAASPER